jgi:riboflavin transporter FmnP
MSILCALAFLCVLLFRFEVGGFLTFDIKDAILAIASFIYGPVAGIICSGLVAFLEFILISDTGPYGLIMNFLSSATFSMIIGLIYKHKRTMNGAVIGVISAVFGMTAVMLLANMFITPLFLGIERTAVMGMIVPTLLPFNVIKAIFNGALVLIIYKPVTQTLKKAKLLNVGSSANYRFGFKSVLLLVISLIILVGAILYLVLKMGGGVDFF